MEKKLIAYKELLLQKMSLHDYRFLEEKTIPYGIQLLFTKLEFRSDTLDKEHKITLNIYFSQKKGISTVIGGIKKDSPFYQELCNIVNQSDKKSEPKAFHSWESWIGSDESGKGDFFGPLVVCGFFADKAIIKSLESMGIKDSKLLNDRQTMKIGAEINKSFSRRFEVITLMPATYNKLYSDFVKQRKKLNQMLSWMHGRVILNLSQKFRCQRAVVDKFVADKTFFAALKDLKNLELIQEVRAESDIAVATSSIMARYHFLTSMKSLSDKYEMDIPKGASKKVIEAGIDFVKKYSAEELSQVAKIHFKTYDEILRGSRG